MKIILLFGLLALAAAQFTNKRNENSDTKFLAYLKSDYQPCVGTLIHQQWVVTAAHCYLPYLQVKIGTANQNVKGWLQDQELNYEFIFRHPNFTADSPEHDIMLIKLAKSKHLHVLVDLPIGVNDLDRSICIISGWIQNWKYPMRDADIQISQMARWLPPLQCKGASSRNITIKNMNNMFCAGMYPYQQNFCQEVSAAVAICKGQLHGILSWTDGCVLKGDIGFYTKVSRYIDWILDIIKKN
uniref:Serine protease 58-like n=1 Tax=Phascolarctos cinereus TaxID=38626 RepID=A0A6P5KVM2_PHACI|nr:serine protease 58-like [Phascolarctos cinereus]XP_020849292.1 serine protease 58-like [Phascolarctos cinereus]XP_020849293.1 serine protease 58-like [Phascolarctos cinereus]